jgi:hypothetical protein
LEISADASAPGENAPLLHSKTIDKSVQQIAPEEKTSSNPDTHASEASTPSVSTVQATAPPAAGSTSVVKPLDSAAVQINAPAATLGSEPTNAWMPITVSIALALVLALAFVVVRVRKLLEIIARRSEIFADDPELSPADVLEFQLREVGTLDNPFNSTNRSKTWPTRTATDGWSCQIGNRICGARIDIQCN